MQDLVYSDKAYTPEALLSNWIVVSGVSLTTSLLFYHMSRVKSLKVRPGLAKMLAIGLIIISTVYLCYAYIPYNKRMNHNIKMCNKLKNCEKDEINELNFLKNSYLMLGLFTIMIQLVIVYLVITTV
jgi:hypothetical protein